MLVSSPWRWEGVAVVEDGRGRFEEERLECGRTGFFDGGRGGGGGEEDTWGITKRACGNIVGITAVRDDSVEGCAKRTGKGG